MMVLDRISQAIQFYWRPTSIHLFVFSFPSKRFTRIYVYAGRTYIAAGNNWAGQLKGYFFAGIFLKGFWKRGPRFCWHTRDE